jgi:hypothetical protein
VSSSVRQGRVCSHSQVGLGLTVVHRLMETEFDEVVGSKHKHNPDRAANRHGHVRGSMTLGGRRVEVSRPRMRMVDDELELPMQSYEYFGDRDPLTRAVMDRMLAGLSTRKYKGGGRAGRRGDRAGSELAGQVDGVGVADPHRAR